MTILTSPPRINTNILGHPLSQNIKKHKHNPQFAQKIINLKQFMSSFTTIDQHKNSHITVPSSKVSTLYIIFISVRFLSTNYINIHLKLYMRQSIKTAPKRLRLGRPGVSLKMGIVGMANIGKSSTFNLLSKLNVPAENFPFCTIEPNSALVKINDPRFQQLCNIFNPNNRVPPVLRIVDIAGLVKGAHEGHGLGNQFLSNIQQVDGIYQVVRAFAKQDIVHTEGGMDAVRDVKIIRNQLIQKDLQQVNKRVQEMKNRVAKAQNKQIKDTYEVLKKIKSLLDSNKQIRCQAWMKQQQVQIINRYAFLTSKPNVFLMNMSKQDYLAQKQIPNQKELVDAITYGGKEPAEIIKYSVQYQEQLAEEESTQPNKSQIGNIISSGYRLLEVIHYFTVGKDEVKAWATRKNDSVVEASKAIHTDFAKGFISAEVIHSDKIIENPKIIDNLSKAMKKEGKTYIVQDGDVCVFNCKFK